MHKTPSQIARSLHALRNAQRLGLLRGVRILPGRDACEAVVAQFGIDYSDGNAPSLPLAQCTRDHCNCRYILVGSDKFRQLNVTRKPSSKLSHD
jgi:hypothetical protein